MYCTYLLSYPNLFIITTNTLVTEDVDAEINILFTAHWTCDPLHVDTDQNCFIIPDSREVGLYSTHGVGLL